MNLSFSPIIRSIFLAFIVLSAGAWVTPAFSAPGKSDLASVSVQQKVNINTANAEALASKLIGVGKKKAEAIIAYRKQHGAFKRVESLLEVKGIGEATLAKNRARIVL